LVVAATDGAEADVVEDGVAEHVRELADQVAVALLRIEVEVEQPSLRVLLGDARQATDVDDVGVVVGRRGDHELPLADPQAGEHVGQPVEEELAVRWRVVAEEERRLVDAVDVAIGRDAVLGAREAQQRVEQIHLREQAVGDLTGGDHAGPAHDAGHPLAALPRRSLRTPERRERRVGPALHLGPVVGREEDQRVVELAGRLELGYQPTHDVVELDDRVLVGVLGG
jgi:hypothetical protein